MTTVTPLRARTYPEARARVNQVTRARFRQHCRPLPKLTMSQWAARYRVLSPEATKQHGPWRNELAPYLVEIMDAISDRVTQEIAVVAPSQSAKSELILNTIGYFIHQQPSPILLVQPTDKMGEAFSKNRIAPMIRDCAELNALVSTVRSRDSNNTILAKAYPGGQLDIVGSNAPGGVSMHPKRVVVMDERDRHAKSAGTEGDVKVLAKARTRSYQTQRKIVEVSSPTDEPNADLTEGSPIWISYLEGTQEIFEVPCPDCGHLQTLEFERLHYVKNDAGQVMPNSVHYQCVSCEHFIGPQRKYAMLLAGKWRATAVPRIPFKRSFRIDGLVAAFALWNEVAQEFVGAGRDPVRLRPFTNTTLGRCWKDLQAENLKQALKLRANAYVAGTEWHVPREAALLTAGWDFQHDRAEGIVRAWGIGEESWLVERIIIRGDTTQPGVYGEIDKVHTQRGWRHESGARVTIRSMCLDAGDGTHQSYVCQYCAPRLYAFVFAIKGSSNPSAPILPRKYSQGKPGRIYVIGVNAITERLHQRLNMPAPVPCPIAVGAGFIHLNEFADDDYIAQLLSEERVIDKKTRKRKFVATGRNEVFDCEKYAYAALHLGPVPISSLALEVEQVNAEGARIKAGQTEPEPSVPVVATSPRGGWLPPTRGGWMRS